MPLERRARSARWAWAAAAAAFAAATLAAADAHGRASRALAAPAGPPDRWVAVVDAGAAVRAWQAAGVRGRRLVVLTGRWSRPPSTEQPATRDEELLVASVGRLAVDATTALLAAAETGIVRRLDVVMPPSAWERRLADVAGEKALVREPGAFSAPFHGLARRFSTPDAFEAPRETVLVLLEPSFLGPGAPEDPAAWARAHDLRTDLAVIALDDPAATDAQRAAARRLAQGGAPAPAEGGVR